MSSSQGAPGRASPPQAMGKGLLPKAQGHLTDFLNPSSKDPLIKTKKSKATKLSSFHSVQPNVRKSHLKYTYLETRVVKNRLIKSKHPSYIPREHCL